MNLRAFSGGCLLSLPLSILLCGPLSGEEVALLPGAPQTRPISGGEEHAFRIVLAPDQAARVEVLQRGIDVALAAKGSGMEAQEIDIYPANEGPEILLLLAGSADPLSITVRALRGHGKTVKTGEYEIRVEDVRQASDQDRLAVQAQVEYSKAKALSAQGKAEATRQATVHLQNAADIAARAGEKRLAATALLDLGGTFQMIRENVGALRAYERALPLVAELGWNRNVGITNSSIGWIYDNWGEYRKSLEHYQKAMEILSKEPDSGTGHPVVLASIGLAYASLGEDRKALEHYERALAIYRTGKNKRGESILLHDIGQVHASAGDLVRAMSLFEEALALQRETSYTRREAQTLTSIARLHSLGGKHAEALPAFEKALALTRSNGDRRLEAVVLDEIAEVQLRMGAVDTARERYGEALAIQRAIQDRRNTALSLYGLARAEQAAGKLSEARAAIDEALAIVETIRGGALPRELRVSFRAATSDLYETQIDILMALHEREPEGSWALQGLEASERARARALTEAFEKVTADVRSGADEALRAKERALRTSLADKENVRTHMLTSNAGAEALAETDREIRGLLAELAETEAAVRGANPRFADVVAPKALTVAQMREDVVDARTALVEFTLGARRSFVWVVTRDQVVVRSIAPRAEIERVARRAHDKLTERNRDAAGESIEARRKRVEDADRQVLSLTRELYDMLLRPVREAVGDRRLLVVPDGPLHLIPFSALHDGTSSMAAQRETIVVPSATALSALRRAPHPAGHSGVIAILADPVFRVDDARLGKPALTAAGAEGSRGTQSALPRLRFSRREASMVDGIVPARDRLIALDFEARRDFIGLASSYRILHFATHALVDNDAPERSSLVLSLVDRNGAAVDGHVRLHEIYNLDLRSELVVLSACDTAAGKEMRGEGLVSLTHGFMYAGARRVVSTLWRIDDRATAELMKHFYSGVLSQDLSPAVALRRAQQELARDKRWSSPYYWAAFVLQGDPG